MTTNKCPHCLQPLGPRSVALLYENEQRITEFCQPLCAIKWNKNSSGSARLLLQEHRATPIAVSKPTDISFIK